VECVFPAGASDERKSFAPPQGPKSGSLFIFVLGKGSESVESVAVLHWERVKSQVESGAFCIGKGALTSGSTDCSHTELKGSGSVFFIFFGGLLRNL